MRFYANKSLIAFVVFILFIELFSECVRSQVHFDHNDRVYRYVGDAGSNMTAFPSDKKQADTTTEVTIKSNVPKFNLVTKRVESTTKRSIPESLKIKLRAVRNMSDFIHKFIEAMAQDDTLHLSYLIDGNSNETNDDYVDERKKLMQLALLSEPAGCTPEMKTVELNSVKAESELYFPWCVKLPRCSGCCPSRRLECVATKVTTVDITGVKLQYSPLSKKFKFKGLKVFKMDKHEQCSCQCIQKPGDCNAAQVYRPEECRCVCRDMKNVIRCLQHRDKIWDRSRCACKCKLTLKCSTGFFFNNETCRCEAVKKSDDTSIIQFASSILRTNDNKEIKQRLKGTDSDQGINPD